VITAEYNPSSQKKFLGINLGNLEMQKKDNRTKGSAQL